MKFYMFTYYDVNKDPHKRQYNTNYFKGYNNPGETPYPKEFMFENFRHKFPVGTSWSHIDNFIEQFFTNLIRQKKLSQI
jgi:hypothetical protein